MFGIFSAFQEKKDPSFLGKVGYPLQDVAKACLQYTPKDRPSMTDITNLLYKAQDAINKGTE
jgi:hypothetical protein